MNRAIGLILCLAGAAGIAAHTYYGREAGEPTAVFTVAQRPAEPAAKPSALPPPKPIETPGDRVSLTRALQFELKRVGCYGGEINGVWTTSSRMAMKSFTDHVNASLPIDTPDYVLLSLVKGHQEGACGSPCPPGQASADGAPCATGAISAKSTPSSEGSSTAVAAGAATAAAIAIAKPGLKATAPDDRPRPTAALPQQEGPPSGKGAQREGSAKVGGPVPAEGVHEQRPRRSKTASQRAKARPPKFVRDFLRNLGFK